MVQDARCPCVRASQQALAGICPWVSGRGAVHRSGRLLVMGSTSQPARVSKAFRAGLMMLDS
jgi:hypothetical protein